MKVYLKQADGSFLATFANAYTINAQRQVWSKRAGKYLLPDCRNRVRLSVNGYTVRVNVNKLFLASQEVNMGQDEFGMSTTPIVQNFTNEGTKEIRLLNYVWRIPQDAKFHLSGLPSYKPIPTQRKNTELSRKFMDRIADPKLRQYPAAQCDSFQFGSWLAKYLDATLTLPDAYRFYRDINSAYTTDNAKLVVQDGNNKVWVNKDGSITVSTNKQVKTLSPRKKGQFSTYTSSLLANNRLTFQETSNLIYGPLTPLLTWSFQGKPQEDDVLFNLTGNTNDLSPANYSWLPKSLLASHLAMRTWLTRRWYYEVVEQGSKRKK